MRRGTALGLHGEPNLVADSLAAIAVNGLGRAIGAADLSGAREEAQPTRVEAAFEQPTRDAEEGGAATQFGALAGKIEVLNVVRIRPVVAHVGAPGAIDVRAARRLLAGHQPGDTKCGQPQQQRAGHPNRQ